MIAVFKREAYMYFQSMTAYVFGAFLLLFTGVGALVYNLHASIANFELVLNFIALILVVLIPLLTMRILSEERRQKTDQLLYSLPITSVDVIVGKFLALMLVFAIPMVIICAYPLIFKQYGDVYLPTSYGSIFAFLLLGMTLISIGIFISSLTESQGMAAGICVAVMIFIYYSDTLAENISSTTTGAVISLIVLILAVSLLIRYMTRSWLAAAVSAVLLAAGLAVCYKVIGTSFEGLLPAVMNQISLFSRFRTFVYGIFDVTAIIYDISITVFFLFLSVQSFEKRRYNG